MNLPLLKIICEKPGAPGFEGRIRDFIIDEIKSLVDDYYIDNMGNLICLKKGKTSKKLAIAAHMDEISFIVTHIDDEGFVRFHVLGGFDPKTLTAQRVIIHGKKDIIGVMGCKPIHLLSAAERKKPLEIRDYFIDTGMSKEDVSKVLSVGDSITRERELIEMGECVNSKSIDNRVSVFILIEMLRKLQNKKPAYDTYAVFTVQEEIGLRGATAAASGIDPDYSINLDTTVANDLPGFQVHEAVTKLGAGTAIKVLDGRTVCDTRMVKFMKQVASKHEIPFQLEILPAGGTDTASFQQHAKGGSVAGAISIPTRYLHQVIEMANKKDIKRSISLLEKCVLEIDDFDFSW
jgi:endoglucanase